MWLRVLLVAAALGFVGYRVALAVAIRRARLAGDVARERRLVRRGFGLYRWVLGALVVFIGVLMLLVWRNG
jgi:hypothetical protein